MNAAALLRKNRNPSDEEIMGAITNLCRCGIYPRLIEAIGRAARVARGDEEITIDRGIPVETGEE
jgi:isoquinoline 1-oxidoreductase alpha subunit